MTEPRRFLLINYEYPPLGGGGGNATRHLGRQLVARGHAVKVLTVRHGDQPSKEIDDGVEVHRVSALRSQEDRSNVIEMISFMIAAIRSGVPLAKTWKPDACLAFFGLPCGPVAHAIQKATGAPYVISLQGGDVPGFLPGRLKGWHRITGAWITRLWRNAAHVVANSEGLGDLAGAHAPDEEIRVIPAGVDLELFSPASEREDSGPLRLIAVGRLSDQKRFDDLLNAVVKLPQPAAVTVTFVGDGPLRGSLASQAARLGLGQQVQFRGWVDREALAQLYQDSDVFVLPSSDEGMSNALLEAMASGLAVIGTEIAGTSEVVVEGETGLLVPVGDVDALSGALRRMVDDPNKAASFGAAGRKRVEAHYDWARAAAAYEELLIDV